MDFGPSSWHMFDGVLSGAQSCDAR
jgi:hypothetical protein